MSQAISESTSKPWRQVVAPRSRGAIQGVAWAETARLSLTECQRRGINAPRGPDEGWPAKTSEPSFAWRGVEACFCEDPQSGPCGALPPCIPAAACCLGPRRVQT